MPSSPSFSAWGNNFEFRVLIIQHTYNMYSVKIHLRKKREFSWEWKKMFSLCTVSKWVSEWGKQAKEREREENFLFIFRLTLHWIDSEVILKNVVVCMWREIDYLWQQISHAQHIAISLLQLLRPKIYFSYFWHKHIVKHWGLAQGENCERAPTECCWKKNVSSSSFTVKKKNFIIKYML